VREGKDWHLDRCLSQRADAKLWGLSRKSQGTSRCSIAIVTENACLRGVVGLSGTCAASMDVRDRPGAGQARNEMAAIQRSSARDSGGDAERQRLGWWGERGDLGRRILGGDGAGAWSQRAGPVKSAECHGPLSRSVQRRCCQRESRRGVCGTWREERGPVATSGACCSGSMGLRIMDRGRHERVRGPLSWRCFQELDVRKKTGNLLQTQSIYSPKTFSPFERPVYYTLYYMRRTFKVVND
jgi:hypothetical protein